MNYPINVGDFGAAQERRDDAVPVRDPGASVTPVFLFSLPRSGSTLVQRILAVHPAIETASEPWLLVPFFYSLLSAGVFAAYGQVVANRALQDFCSGLPGGINEYLAEVKQLALRLYTRHAGPRAKYFVDKTPRYHVIAPEILRTFDDARFIFLWRNPLSVVSSIIETWGRGRWNIYEFGYDLYDGLEKLVDAQKQAGDRACCVRFEDLVAGDKDTWRRMFAGLDLEFDERQLALFADVPLSGRMGDKSGQRMYQTLSRAPIDIWKKTLTSPLRKSWCRSYLDWIGDERLQLMGYDRKQLLQELDAVPNRYRTVPADIARMCFGIAFRVFEPRILREKWARWRSGKHIYSHY